MKGWLQNGQALSLEAFVVTLPFCVVVGADDEGVETVAGVCEASAMVLGESNGAGTGAAEDQEGTGQVDFSRAARGRMLDQDNAGMMDTASVFNVTHSNTETWAISMCETCIACRM